MFLSNGDSLRFRLVFEFIEATFVSRLSGEELLGLYLMLLFGKNIDKFGKFYNFIIESVFFCGGGSNAGDGDNEKKNFVSCFIFRELLIKTVGKVKSENNNKKFKFKFSSSTLDDII